MKFIEAASTPAEVCGEPRASPHQARLVDLLPPRLSGSFLLYKKLALQTAQAEARLSHIHCSWLLDCAYRASRRFDEAVLVSPLPRIPAALMN